MDGRLSKRIRRLRILVAVLAVIIVLLTVFILRLMQNDGQAIDVKPKKTPVLKEESIKETAKPLDTAEPQAEPESTFDPGSDVSKDAARRGTAQPIPGDIRNSMDGLSMHSNSDISYDDLSYLSIPYYDFSGNTTVGHMVVNKDIAEEVLDIFAELYDIKYPIERMELIDKYGADDYTSIENNNTSAFNYRVSTDGSGRLSKHALGRAIDINPQINPYVNSSGAGSHENAREYWSRDYKSWSSDVAKEAYIGPETQIYKIFVEEHGWEWGGSWTGYRDYQHFQKVS